jgi:hypothetical protein
VNGSTRPFKKVFSTQSAKDSLKGMADGDLKPFRSYSYRTAQKEVIPNQKKSLWFMCYKSVKGVIVAQPSERSNITKCQTNIQELLLHCPGNTRQYAPIPSHSNPIPTPLP